MTTAINHICQDCGKEIKGGVFVAALGGTIRNGPFSHYHCRFPEKRDVIEDIARRRAAAGLSPEV